MKVLDKISRSRLKLVVYFGTGILLIGVWSVFKGMEGTSTAAIVALGGIIAKYNHDETKRPSNG